METVRDVIKKCTKEHLMERNSLLFGQNLTAVGWVSDTIPSDIHENKGLIELPTSDISNSGIVVGAALAGRRPIYVIRYQGFLTFNSSFLANYAAKSQYLWKENCPVFIRALSMEGNIGPVASNSHHSSICRFPGMDIFAPMTPNEWKNVWEYFLNNDNPVFCSESRLSFGISEEMPHIIRDKSNITIFAISTARLNAIKAVKILEKEGIECDLLHLTRLQPTNYIAEFAYFLSKGKFGLVIDSDYEDCGISRDIAYKLMLASKKPVYALGLEHRTAGFSAQTDNITPTLEKIVKFIKDRLND